MSRIAIIDAHAAVVPASMVADDNSPSVRAEPAVDVSLTHGLRSLQIEVTYVR